jgi:hypothetical protein
MGDAIATAEGSFHGISDDVIANRQIVSIRDVDERFTTILDEAVLQGDVVSPEFIFEAGRVSALHVDVDVVHHDVVGEDSEVLKSCPIELKNDRIGRGAGRGDIYSICSNTSRDTHDSAWPCAVY